MLYPFGHGLSYTEFTYSELKLSSRKLRQGETLSISINISNTGNRTGTEVVQLYLHDKIASIAPALRKLKGFEKISLEAGETQTVHFKLTESDLAFVGRNLQWITEPGTFEVLIGDLKSEFEWIS